MQNDVVLKLSGLCKDFGAVKVLKNIDLELRKGEVLGLVGENGAGKSTMMNVLGGVYPKTSGDITLFGSPYTPENPSDATRAGIAFIHQELNLFTNLSIAENLFIDEGMDGRKLFSPKAMKKRAGELLHSLGIDVDPITLVEKLTMGMRQMVEIAKAVAKKAKIIFFDEPTTSLSTSEKETLFRLIRSFAKQNISMIYISHALDDVFQLCDEIVVIRDGEKIGEQTPSAQTSKDEIISRMVGRSMSQMYSFAEREIGGELLKLSDITRAGVLNGVSLTVYEGEIVGMFGLMGAGRTELLRAVYGIDPMDGGKIVYRGKAVKRPAPADWVRHKVAFITENRRDEGLLLPKNVLDNMSLVNLPALSRKLGLFDRKKQKADTQRMMEHFRIKTTPNGKQTLRNLSGGNQQKVVLGKWLLIQPSLFLLDEPTRGVDVGAKFEIYTHINRLAQEGSGILFISSEMEELMGVCDRILVMRRGKIAGEVRREQYSQDTLLKLAIGDGSNE